MSHKTKQRCDNCGALIRQGFPVGRNLFCSQGKPDERPPTCLEAFARRR